MIQLYTWPTPNGHKVHIMLEECDLEYTVRPINIGRGDQFEPAFLRISPNNKMPAILDEDGPGGEPYSLFESGAILIYLADKTGKFMPRRTEDPRGFYDVLQWVMFQMGTQGPMLGQTHHFRKYAPEQITYAIERYTNEASRLYRVLDNRLGESPYLAGERYTVADIINFPWIRGWEGQGQNLDDTPNLKRWFEEIAARPAVQRGVEVLADQRRTGSITDEEREVMFGKKQYAAR